ncbi:DNA-directed RNA polymerase III subunit RPC7-like isoform X4 [Stigmatopora argus]
MMSSGRGRRRGGEPTPAAVNRGEPFLPSVQQPGPAFPAAERTALPLACGEEAEYLLALKQEFRGAMKTLPSFTQTDAAAQRSHADVERYSDKYHNGGEQTEALNDWIAGTGEKLRARRPLNPSLSAAADWKRFPKEIRLSVTRTRKKGRSAPGNSPAAAAADLPSVLTHGQTSASAGEAKGGGARTLMENKQVLVKLEMRRPDGRVAEGGLKANPQTPAGEERRGSDDEEEEDEEEKEGGQEVEEDYDEEEVEEETDYIMSYFDNGEEFGAESDDNLDEAVY